MAVKLSDLLKNERTIKVDIQGTDLTVTYRPSSITPETQDVFYAMMEKQRSGLALAEILTQRVVAWDLTDDEGEEIEISFDELKTIPVDVLAFVSNAILADMEADADDQKNLGDGSRRAGSKGHHRNGTR